MGYQTDFIGYLEIDPPLGQREITVVNRISGSPFLVPGATAERIRGMTCDHVLNGMVVGSRRDTRELYSITARSNEIRVELLWPGNPGWSDYPRLAYQTEIDRFRDWVIDQKARR